MNAFREVLTGARKGLDSLDSDPRYTRWLPSLEFGPALNRVAKVIDLASTAVRRAADGSIVERTRTLTDIISLYPNLHASDPRDCIYGLLALVKQTKLPSGIHWPQTIHTFSERSSSLAPCS
jgi:hypothetical protein